MHKSTCKRTLTLILCIAKGIYGDAIGYMDNVIHGNVIRKWSNSCRATLSSSSSVNRERWIHWFSIDILKRVSRDLWWRRRFRLTMPELYHIHTIKLFMENKKDEWFLALRIFFHTVLVITAPLGDPEFFCIFKTKINT